MSMAVALQPNRRHCVSVETSRSYRTFVPADQLILRSKSVPALNDSREPEPDQETDDNAP